MSAPARFAWLAERPRGSTARAASIVLAVILGVQCALAAVSALSEQIPFSEYLGQARRCVELNDCPSRGGRTGALPLFHGASWIRLLAYSLEGGHDLTRIQSIVLATWLLSIPITFFALHRYLGLGAATLALGLYFPIILVGSDITNLTYTNLLPLLFAVYYASIALFVESRRTVWAAVASVALSAAVSVELGGIAMVPFHVLLVGLMAPRRIGALIVCALALVIPFCLDSMDAAREIARQVPTLRFAIGLAISAGIVAVVARSASGLLLPAAGAVADRVRAAMTAALIYAVGTIWLANVFLMRGVPAARYLLPASFPFLYLIAERMKGLGARATIALAALESLALLLLLGASRGLDILQVFVVAVVTFYACALPVRRTVAGRAWLPVATCVVAIAVSLADLAALAKRGPAQEFTLAEAEGLVAKLYAADYTYPELVGSLQGPAADDLMSLLTERDPELFAAARPNLPDPDFSLLVVKVPDAAVSRIEGLVAAVPVRHSRSAVAVRGGRPYLDWKRMRRCSWEDTRYACSEPRTDRPLPHNWPYVEFGKASSVADSAVSGEAAKRGFRYEVPARTAGRGVAHVVRTSNEWPAAWRIVGVSGLEFDGELPATEIRLPDRRAAAGSVTFEYAAPFSGDLPWVWLPHVLEVGEDDAPLLAAIRAG